MSRETLEWLNTHTLVGYGRKAWHFSSDAQGDEPNHYDGAIPADDVRRRLFSFTADPYDLSYEFNGETVYVDGKQAVIHSETGAMLGIHSDSYSIHQFQDSLLAGVETICGNGLGIESAGLLQQGAVGWVSVSLQDTSTVTLPNGDDSGIGYVTRLLAFGSHNGKYATSYKLVNTLVVCDNTLALAAGESGQAFKVRHTAHSLPRVKDAQEALGLILGGQDAFAAEVAKLVETTVTDAQWSEFVKRMAPISPEQEKAGKGKALTMATTKRERLTQLWNSDPRVEPWKGTAFGAIQAVNTWQHWDSIVRNAERQERNTLAQMDGSWERHDASTLATLQGVLASV